MNELGLRILRFYEFCFKMRWDCSISWFENEFHVTVSQNGNIYTYGQAKRLSDALDDCAKGLKAIF